MLDLLYAYMANANVRKANETANEAQESASDAHAESSVARVQADDMSTRIGTIELAVETLVRLGIQQNNFTEEQFLAMAREVDAEGGVMDGRRDLRRMTKICGKCGKSNPATRSACMWCETSLMEQKAVPA